jgi:hypothetical protein
MGDREKLAAALALAVILSKAKDLLLGSSRAAHVILTATKDLLFALACAGLPP